MCVVVLSCCQHGVFGLLQSPASSWTPRSSELSSKLKVREDKLHSLEEEKVKLVSACEL